MSISNCELAVILHLGQTMRSIYLSFEIALRCYAELIHACVCRVRFDYGP